MKRGSRRLLAVAVLAWLSPSLYAQYPNPYAPPAYAPMPMPGYGYPPQMMMRPVYYPPPNPMLARPMYYYPPPMQRPPMPYPPRYANVPQNMPQVNNYGPLQPETSVPLTSPAPSPAPQMLPASGLFKAKAPKADVVSDGCGPQGCPPNGSCSPSSSCGSDSCSTGACSTGSCASGLCNDGCDVCKRPLPVTPPCPRGHFIGMVGVEFLTPFPQTRNAYTTTTAAGATTTTNFPSQLQYAPFGSLGYVWHNGWGVRGDFLYLHGNTNLTTTNPALTTTVLSQGAPGFQIVSPSATLAAGIGADQFNFSRTFNLRIADLEVIKECNVFDACFIFGFGARYASIAQGYNATRTNGGGANPVTGNVVTVDQQNLGLLSRFEGTGPTVSMDFVHPLRGTCFSFYSNVRGSALYGIERFSSDYNLTSTVPSAAAVTPTTVTNSNETIEHRVVGVLDLEAGLQMGKRIGRAYYFSRIGGVYHRFWDVGTPVSANGSLDLVGGALKFGVIY